MKERFKELFTVAAYGCVWGLLELTLGGYLHFIHFPHNVFIFGVPIFSRSIVNPALAIIAEAASVTFVAFVISRLERVKATN